MSINLENQNILDWTKEYKGELFHAVLCDPPYHLTSIVKRFGKDNSAPAKFGTDGAFARASKGFMGKSWDGGDIAFNPETWFLIKNVLYDGAFGMAFASARGFHRMAVAIEDAGFIIHPMLGWVYGSGFPKATKIKDNEVFEGHKYGLQALKPALEPIIVFQKPYEGKPVERIIETGAGTLNIDAGRIGNSGSETHSSNKKQGNIYGKYEPTQLEIRNCGRFPSNMLFTHHADCKLVGTKKGKGYVINRWGDDMHPFGEGAGNEFKSFEMDGGLEEVWECVDGCPIKSLNEKTGIRKSGRRKASYDKGDEQGNAINHGIYGKYKSVPFEDVPESEGTASRFFSNTDWELDKQDPFFYCQKANGKERNEGIEEHNVHPTVKPLKLNTYLAKLLLPPDEYKPRRLLVPFAGVASEMIGGILAGWEDITGIELTEEYIPIALDRLKYWEKVKNES